ncbi:hypothetical protein ACS8FD_23365, partial [Psychrobacter sp. 1U2]
ILQSAKDEHTLTGYKWDRVYPILANGKLLFQYSDTVDSAGQNNPDIYKNRVSTLDKRVLHDEQRIGLYPKIVAEQYFIDTSLAEGEEINLDAQIGEFRQELSATPYKIRVVKTSQHRTYIASLEKDSYLLKSRHPQMLARQLGSTVVQPLGAVLHEDGLDTLLSVQTQTRFKETRNPWLLRSDIVSLD